MYPLLVDDVILACEYICIGACIYKMAYRPNLLVLGLVFSWEYRLSSRTAIDTVSSRILWMLDGWCEIHCSWNMEENIFTIICEWKGFMNFLLRYTVFKQF